MAALPALPFLMQPPPFSFVPFPLQPPMQICQHPELWHPDHMQTAGVQGHDMKRCLQAFKAHTQHLLRHPQAGADVLPDENDAALVELLLHGGPGTPYQGGFFHFSVRATPGYPDRRPPRVAFRTASSRGRVRFNPNFYENGCVCLSILGTWPGPDTWQESYTLGNLLHALQYRLNDQPLFNEPALAPDPAKRAELSRQYNDQLAYETLRVSVCDQLERRSLPPALHRRAAGHFARHYQAYRDRCAELRKRLDGLSIVNVYHAEPFEDTYEFAAVFRRMEKLLPIAQRDAGATDE